ncbi:MAG: FkbM family methyltransferase [Albidovulum sp.]
MADQALPPFMALLARLEKVPNAIGRSAGRKLKRRMAPRSLAEFEARLARLGPSDICLDLGANIGTISARLAATGALVHAYEPDPETFARLQENTRHLPNVVLHPKAVGQADGTVFLRRIKGFSADPSRHSLGSSVVFDDPAQFDDAPVAVEQVGFRRLLASFTGRIALIKMDIEGAEFDILNDIMDGTLPGNFDALYVETHENAAPARRAEIFRHRASAQRREHPHIDLFWP